MRITFEWNGINYASHLDSPIEIAIPLKNGMQNQPNAYNAPFYEATPVRDGGFVGSIEAGAPVNFYNIALNPHGNGTHTECVGHILSGQYFIREALVRTHFVAELISVHPEWSDGDHIIRREQIGRAVQHRAEALIVRTLPNDDSKLARKYTDTNPPYFEPLATEWIRHQGYLHLLTDLPSVDPEIDGGVLAAHKAFWDVDGSVRVKSTISEMVYLPSSIPDGLYLLDLHNLALELDVSPSRPVLFAMEKES